MISSLDDFDVVDETLLGLRSFARVSPIIHQIWMSKDGKDMPLEWRSSPASWKEHHPDYHYILWDNYLVNTLLNRHYPWFSETYREFKYFINKVDAARLMIIHRYGGIYADLDVEAVKSFIPLLDMKGPYVCLEKHMFYNNMLW